MKVIEPVMNSSVNIGFSSKQPPYSGSTLRTMLSESSDIGTASPIQTSLNVSSENYNNTITNARIDILPYPSNSWLRSTPDILANGVTTGGSTNYKLKEGVRYNSDFIPTQVLDWRDVTYDVKTDTLFAINDYNENFYEGVVAEYYGQSLWKRYSYDVHYPEGPTYPYVCVFDPEGTLFISSNEKLYRRYKGYLYEEVLDASDNIRDVVCGYDGESIIAVCDSGDIWGSSDSGDSWSNVYTMPDDGRKACALDSSSPTLTDTFAVICDDNNIYTGDSTGGWSKLTSFASGSTGTYSGIVYQGDYNRFFVMTLQGDFLNYNFFLGSWTSTAPFAGGICNDIVKVGDYVYVANSEGIYYKDLTGGSWSYVDTPNDNNVALCYTGDDIVVVGKEGKYLRGWENSWDFLGIEDTYSEGEYVVSNGSQYKAKRQTTSSEERPDLNTNDWKFITDNFKYQAKVDPVNTPEYWQASYYNNHLLAFSGLSSDAFTRTYGVFSDGGTGFEYKDWYVTLEMQGAEYLLSDSSGLETSVTGIKNDNFKDLYISNLYEVDEVICETFNGGGVLQDQRTYILDGYYTEGVENWYSYFFLPYTYLSRDEKGYDQLIQDLPYIEGGYVRLTFKATSSSFSRGVGKILFGWSKTLGTTDYGTSGNIQDYSIKTTNDFGEYTITERKFSKIVDYNLTIPLKQTPSVQRFLAKNRATPLVWIGNEDFDNTITYGFWKDFDIPLSDFSNSYASIEVEGL